MECNFKKGLMSEIRNRNVFALDRNEHARLLGYVSNTNSKVIISLEYNGKKYNNMNNMINDNNDGSEYPHCINNCKREEMIICDFIESKECTTKELNYSSEEFGDTPLTLAILKGRHHGDKSLKQGDIIDAILSREDAELNLKCTVLDMTPIEIAILVGDIDMVRFGP